MATELAKQTARTLDVKSTMDSPYMPGFDGDDYAPPEYRVIQAMSKAHTERELPMGHFYCEQTEDLKQKLDLVILRVQRNLTLWGKGDMNAPQCSSDNRITPRPGGKHQGPCGSCPARGKECFPGYNLLAMAWEGEGSFETPNLFLLRVNGTSVFPFRKLWAKVAQQYGNQPWKFILNLSTEKRTNQSGTFFVMMPRIEMDFNADSQVKAKALADNFLSLDINAVDREAQQAHARTAFDHQQGPSIVDGQVDQRASNVVDSQAVQRPKVRGITKAEAWQTVEIAKALGVPETTIAAYIAHTFGPKTKLGELHTGEWTMLNAWLYQEYGQTKDTNKTTTDEDDIGELPF
ncbi:MAG: hypothetical protein ACREQA_20670 [Candidatus Binatia bacterium]